MADSLLTVEEFFQLPEKPEIKRELVQGVVVEMGAAALRHEIVKSNFTEALTLDTAKKRIGKVFSESMFVLAESAAHITDVAFVLSQESRPQ